MTSNDQLNVGSTPSNPVQTTEVEQQPPPATVQLNQPQTESQKQPQICFKNSTVGKAVSIKGTVIAHEDMLINGQIVGLVELKNNRIEIGENGRIEANTFANVVVISGELKGDVYANEQVVITKTGRVYGNVFAVDVCIEDGAILKGKIDTAKYEAMIPQQPVVTPPPPVAMPLLSDLHEDDNVKASSLTSLFKKVQEIAHLHSNQHVDHVIKMDGETTATVPPPDTAKNAENSTLDNNTNIQYVFPDKTVIGQSVLIKGDLISDEDVKLQGKVEGVVYFRDNSLEVTSGALLKANVFVKSLVSQGDIKGDIYASDQVRINKSGHLNGNIYAPRIVVESGAVVTGIVEMEPQNIEKLFSDVTNTTVEKESLNNMNKSENHSNNHSRRSQNRELGMPRSSKKQQEVPA